MRDTEDRKSAVVRIEKIGDMQVLMHTPDGRPAIYHRAEDAELFALKLRTDHPDYRFKVIDFQLQ